MSTSVLIKLLDEILKLSFSLATIDSFILFSVESTKLVVRVPTESHVITEGFIFKSFASVSSRTAVTYANSCVGKTRLNVSLSKLLLAQCLPYQNFTYHILYIGIVL